MIQHEGNEAMFDIKSTVRHFIIENFLFGSEPDSFNDDDSLLENGIIDSTGILELIVFIEDSCDIKIQDEEIIPENLDSLDNIFLFVRRKKADCNGSQ